LEGLSSVNNCKDGGNAVVSYTDTFGLKRMANVKCNAGAMPISWYRFDEGSGATAGDSVGDNGGLLQPPSPAGPTWQTGCAAGSCLQFNGSSDYVDVGDKASLNFATNDFTVSAWFNTSQTTEDAPIVGKKYYTHDVEPGYALCFQNQSVYFRISDDSAYRIISAAGSNLADGQWHHAVVVRNGNTFTAYADGFADPTPGTETYDLTNDRDFVIGVEGRKFGRFFTGQVDEVKVFNRALSAFEVCSACLEHAASLGTTCTC